MNTNKTLNILISSAGRRVELMQCFRDALDSTGKRGHVYASDCSLTSPACSLSDGFWQVPRCSEPEFIPELLDLAIREHIDVIVPTIDSELGLLAAQKQRFAENGIHVCISSAETVEICSDKVVTHRWLCANGFPTMRQAFPDEVLMNREDWPLPLIAKPRWGSASKGVRVIDTFDELSAYAGLSSDLIVQQVAAGEEHTVNVFVSRDGECVCAVPHRRLETRGGEVSKAVTVKHGDMMALASRVAERLPGARGMLNIQCFLSAEGDIRIIEINARAGGGYPLAHSAGAHYTHWILDELLQCAPLRYFDGWIDDLALLRYDQSVVRPAAELREFSSEPAALYSVGSR